LKNRDLKTCRQSENVGSAELEMQHNKKMIRQMDAKKRALNGGWPRAQNWINPK
jgi:hypothetical protein